MRRVAGCAGLAPTGGMGLQLESRLQPVPNVFWPVVKPGETTETRDSNKPTSPKRSSDGSAALR